MNISTKEHMRDGRIQDCWNGRERFVILEAGLDSGCNFLAAWLAWREDSTRPQQLHYLAIEPVPFPAEALRKLHEAWPQYQSISEELCQAWPPMLRGFHRLFFEQGHITLTLVFDDVPNALQQLDAKVNAFAINLLPNRGGLRTWEKNDFSQITRMADDQALLSIPSTSASIQSHFEKIGFVFEQYLPASPSSHYLHASFSPRWQTSTERTIKNTVHKAIVIGAGLAGTAACERLAARGWQISLIEHHVRAAQEASGNLAGIFMPLLSKDDNATSRLTRAAFLFALQAWKNIGGVGSAFSGETCGVLQLARNDAHAKLQHDIARIWQYPTEFAQWLDAPATAALLGTATGTGGWLFPQGGWASPQEVCRAMLSACGEHCTPMYSQYVSKLVRTPDGWQVCDAEDRVIAEAPVVILANGNGAAQLAQSATLPLTAVRGQVSHFLADLVPQLPLVACREGYITRSTQGICSVGASYDLDDDPVLRQDSQNENLKRLSQISPTLSNALLGAPLAGRVGFRSVSPDRLPLVGALPDMAALADFRGDRLKDIPRLPGLYGLLGYASRGLIWAPIAAELLACQLSGEPLPIEAELFDAIDPARFALKAHRRR